MRIAVLGAGNWGKNHVRVFCDLLGTANVVVFDPDRTRREAMVTAYPGLSTASDPIFDRVDAVVIATPVASHHKLAREALLSGKHVLVEKPITTTARDAEDLVALAKECDRILMVDHLLEYHPAVCALRGLVREGKLGRILHISSQRLNLGVIRSEENALWSLAPHDVSVILDLFGEAPIGISAQGAAFVQPGIEDVAYLALRFPSGAVAHVHVSWLDPIKTRRIVVVGSQAMAVFDEVSDEKLVIYDKRAKPEATTIDIVNGDGRSVPLDSGEPLRKVAETFLSSIKSGTPPRSDGEDGLRVVRVLETAQESMNLGGMPIEGVA